MKINLLDILKKAREDKASDVFVVAGLPLSVKINGDLVPVTDFALKPEDTNEIVKEIYQIANSNKFQHFNETGDEDFSFSVTGVGRFRVSTYMQRGSMAAVLRIVSFELPNPEELCIPRVVIDFYRRTKGLILVTGPAGSGKSTTLACIIDAINSTRKGHIMTLEDPIEFLHRHKQSIVSQREITTDTVSYLQALKSSLRQSPDVILVGEMRDLETINIALTAAETGHLMLSTLHTMGCANSIDRIIDVFPPVQQQQIRVQLSMVLQAVVSQQLLPTVDKGLVAAFEVMINTTAIANMIRESKLHQINSVMHSSGDLGMITMDASIIELYKKGRITKEVALTYSTNPEVVARQIN